MEAVSCCRLLQGGALSDLAAAAVCDPHSIDEQGAGSAVSSPRPLLLPHRRRARRRRRWDRPSLAALAASAARRTRWELVVAAGNNNDSAQAAITKVAAAAGSEQPLTLYGILLYPCPTQPNGGGSTSTAMRVGALSLGIMSRLIQVVRMLHQVS